MRIYKNQFKIDPYIKFLIAFILFTIFASYLNCNAQAYIDISKRNNSCEDMEYAYVIAYYPGDVYSMSLILFYDSTSWNLNAVCRNDVFIDGMALDSIHDNRYIFSWFSLSPLQYSDTLFALIFTRKGYYGGDLEWSVQPDACEITDFNAVPIPCQFNNGWLRCLVSSMPEETRKPEKNPKRGFKKYNILGQEIW